MCLGFRLKLVDEFTKIVPSAFRPFIGYNQGLLVGVKSVFMGFLKDFFSFFHNNKITSTHKKADKPNI